MKLIETRTSSSPPLAARRARPPRASRRRVAVPASPTDRLRGWLHDGLRDLPATDSVLALGCDEAFFAPHLADYSSAVTVLDSSAGQLAQLARRFPEIAFLRHDPSQPLPLGRNAFAAIWCCEFLDRVFDPAAALREMHRVLAPGGRLLVTVPDCGHREARTFSARDELSAAAAVRIQHFTRSSLLKLARQAGFVGARISAAGEGSHGAGDCALFLRAQKALAGQMERVGSPDRALTDEVDLMDDGAVGNSARAA